MSTVQARTAVEAIHMRVVYFAADGEADEPDKGDVASRGSPVLPEDLTRVFRQLDLLFEYAEMTGAPAESLPASLASGRPEAPTLMDALKQSLEKVREKDKTESQRLDRSEEAGEDWSKRVEKLPEGLHSALTSAYFRHYRHRQQVPVISLRMGSPLEVLFEIPMVAWPGLAIGLIALTERIATMPVRIARKRKQELLKTTIIDRTTELVNDARADVLAQLLLQEGPHRTARGPDEVVFLDPDQPDDELSEIRL